MRRTAARVSVGRARTANRPSLPDPRTRRSDRLVVRRRGGFDGWQMPATSCLVAAPSPGDLDTARSSDTGGSRGPGCLWRLGAYGQGVVEYVAGVPPRLDLLESGVVVLVVPSATASGSSPPRPGRSATTRSSRPAASFRSPWSRPSVATSITDCSAVTIDASHRRVRTIAKSKCGIGGEAASWFSEIRATARPGRRSG